MYDECYKALGTAIVMLAAYDYEANRIKLLNAKSQFDRIKATDQLSSIERFFLSKHFSLLCDLDGREFFQKIKSRPLKKTSNIRGRRKKCPD